MRILFFKSGTLTPGQVFLTADPGNPSNRMLWGAVLRGGLIATPRRLLGCSDSGPCIGYKAALKTKRQVWLSSEFNARHPALATIIQDAVFHARQQNQQVKWKFLSSEVEFLAKKQNVINKGRAAEVLGIGVKNDKKD